MPAYVNTPFKPTPILLVPGFRDYAWGGYNYDAATTRMWILTDAVSSNVATITAQLLEGNLPIVGQNVSIGGTANSSGGFNGGPYPVLSVSQNTTTLVVTITFALTLTNQSAAADGGLVLGAPVTTYETLPSSATASRSFAAGGSNVAGQGQRGITWFTEYTGSPSTVTANLQGADIDEDASFTTIDSSTNASGESRSVGSINYLFYRIQLASTGGTSPKVAAGLMVR